MASLCEALPGVAYPGVWDIRSTLNTKTGYDEYDDVVPHQIIWSWYTGHWWMGCCIWYSEEGHGWAAAPPSPVAHPSTTSVPITVLLYGGPLVCGFNVVIKGLRNTKQRMRNEDEQSIECKLNLLLLLFNVTSWQQMLCFVKEIAGFYNVHAVIV